jgi:hypothetical protein
MNDNPHITMMVAQTNTLTEARTAINKFNNGTVSGRARRQLIHQMKVKFPAILKPHKLWKAVPDQSEPKPSTSSEAVSPDGPLCPICSLPNGTGNEGAICEFCAKAVSTQK